MYIVYIIQSEANKRYYTGITQDIKKRIRHHNSGANKSTKGKGSWRVIYQEQFRDKESAWRRERQIKKYKGGEAFKKLLVK
ncbi:MAG: GIY-YIG nuclease family protein [Patescibacteria group bacterium]